MTRPSLRPLLSRLNDFLSRRSKLAVILLCLLLVALLGVLDYATGHELTIFFVYLIPVLLITWYAGLKWGIALTILSAFVWTYANELAGHQIRGIATHYWNTGIRLMMFFLVVYLLTGLRNSLRHEKELSRVDFLTGVLNRREFMRLASLEVQRSRRYHHTFTLAYIDLNNFKQVNDTYGHDLGDCVLRAVAQSMQANLRSSDLLGRLGGDEFAILFPEADQRAALHALGKVHAVLDQGIGINHIRIAISAGVVSYQSPPEEIEAMLVRADQLMYQAKANGQEICASGS